MSCNYEEYDFWDVILLEVYQRFIVTYFHHLQGR
jgi:hypothetical protein